MGLEASLAKSYLHGVKQFLSETEEMHAKHLNKLKEQLRKVMKERHKMSQASKSIYRGARPKQKRHFTTRLRRFLSETSHGESRYT
eukprot:5983073-Amphidinium_carterae.1